MLARAVLICLSGLLLFYTWVLYNDVRRVSDGPQHVARRGVDESGVSGEGAPVRCYNLQLEAPKKTSESRSSFRVRENGPGIALREALGSGAVRYCSSGGLVYRAVIASRETAPDSRFDVLLSSPVDDEDPSSFPIGSAADKGYTLAPPDAKVSEKSADPPYTDAFMIFF